MSLTIDVNNGVPCHKQNQCYRSRKTLSPFCRPSSKTTSSEHNHDEDNASTRSLYPYNDTHNGKYLKDLSIPLSSATLPHLLVPTPWKSCILIDMESRSFRTIQLLQINSQIIHYIYQMYLRDFTSRDSFSDLRSPSS